jgi:hypothetical protein
MQKRTFPLFDQIELETDYFTLNTAASSGSDTRKQK